MPTAIEAVVAAVAMFIGSTVLSTVGFGIGMTAIPILLFVLEPQTVIVVLNTVSIPLFALIVYQNRAELPKRSVLPWAVAGMIGVPVGVIILRDADATLLKIAITVVIIALTTRRGVERQDAHPKGHDLGTRDRVHSRGDAERAGHRRAANRALRASPRLGPQHGQGSLVALLPVRRSGRSGRIRVRGTANNWSGCG